ncbi:MAG: bifunctional glutamate N-acetyltransferase/amino-acid acetyltransferase ArgJ [Planctomycetes bacterium]|nr:bifunctional glutamate N-acetyltransferase/amino-acid acetyltransferase ArgJ [Planctomycetota bacterium]
MSDWQEIDGGIACVAGFRCAGAVGGIKPSGKADVAVIVGDKPVIAAGCFTQNQAAAASVAYCRRILERNEHRGVVVNSGNANCCTGDAGMIDTLAMAASVAQELGADVGAEAVAEDFFVSSTGVIGVPLPMDAVTHGIKQACAQLHGEDPQHSAADAILTTDLVAKEIAFQHASGYHVAGISKGSGMIHPNMATMLGYVLTDVQIEKKLLQEICSRAVSRSFNSISVDNDESTNDTCLVFASGASATVIGSEQEVADFEILLTHCLQQLAQKIVRDGEGATHFIEVEVRGAQSEVDADAVAGAICDSMLVKTAIAGNDPNWGRILCAAGYSGVEFELNASRVILNGVVIFSEGSGHDDDKRPFVYAEDGSSLARETLAETMTANDISIIFDLGGAGPANQSATRWTSDLTHGYITINADYTT